jgi:hypothetical protein
VEAFCALTKAEIGRDVVDAGTMMVGLDAAASGDASRRRHAAPMDRGTIAFIGPPARHHTTGGKPGTRGFASTLGRVPDAVPLSTRARRAEACAEPGEGRRDEVFSDGWR